MTLSLSHSLVRLTFLYSFIFQRGTDKKIGGQWKEGWTSMYICMRVSVRVELWSQNQERGGRVFLLCRVSPTKFIKLSVPCAKRGSLV